MFRTSQPHPRSQDEVSVELCRGKEVVSKCIPPPEERQFFPTDEEHTQQFPRPKVLGTQSGSCDGLARLLQICIKTGEYPCSG